MGIMRSSAKLGIGIEVMSGGVPAVTGAVSSLTEDFKYDLRRYRQL
jgi:hypothetical protein